jgi:hypothetical protein
MKGVWLFVNSNDGAYLESDKFNDSWRKVFASKKIK